MENLNNLGIPDDIFQEILESDEYDRYCAIYNIMDRQTDKAVSAFLIWKSFGMSC